jgi:hypothetical protein
MWGFFAHLPYKNMYSQNPLGMELLYSCSLTSKGGST